MNENEIYSIYFYRQVCEVIQFNFQNVFVLDFGHWKHKYRDLISVLKKFINIPINIQL